MVGGRNYKPKYEYETVYVPKKVKFKTAMGHKIVFYKWLPRYKRTRKVG